MDKVHLSPNDAKSNSHLGTDTQVVITITDIVVVQVHLTVVRVPVDGEPVRIHCRERPYFLGRNQKDFFHPTAKLKAVLTANS